jgi:hypothetical protein
MQDSGDHGFGTLGRLGHPRVFNPAGPVDLEAAPIVGPSPAFVLHRKIEKIIYNWI